MAKEYRHFTEYPTGVNDKTTHQFMRDWFKSLYDHKGERAMLRRCTTPNEVFMTNGFSRVFYPFERRFAEGSEQMIALACAAGVISHVKNDIEDPDKSFAKQMAQPKAEGGQPKVSLLRFSQLQKSYSWDEFYRRLIRMVKLLDGNINIISLTDDIFHWAKEFKGDFERSPMNRLQVRWAADYYHILNNPKSKPSGK